MVNSKTSALVDRAFALRRAGKSQEAIQILSRLLERYPVGDLYNERALAYLDCGDIDRAVVDLTDGIAVNGTDPDLFNNRGNAYLLSGAMQSAIDDYTTAIQLSPDNAKAFNGCGQAFAELGRTEDAISNFKQAIQINPTYESPLFNLALLYRQLHKFDQSLDCLNEAARLKPHDWTIRCLRGEIFEQMKDERSAYEEYQRAVTDHPEAAPPHRRLCRLLSTSTMNSLRKTDKALHHGEKCCELTGYTDTDCLEAYAAANAACGLFEEAVRLQSIVVELYLGHSSPSRLAFDKATKRLHSYRDNS